MHSGIICYLVCASGHDRGPKVRVNRTGALEEVSMVWTLYVVHMQSLFIVLCSYQGDPGEPGEPGPLCPVEPPGVIGPKGDPVS